MKIFGDGPLEPKLREITDRSGAIELEGRQPIDEVYELMRHACMLIFPSEWFEGMPRTILETVAVSTPVIASRLGAMAEIVEDRVTGLQFTSGDAQDLAGKVRRPAALVG